MPNGRSGGFVIDKEELAPMQRAKTSLDSPTLPEHNFPVSSLRRAVPTVRNAAPLEATDSSRPCKDILPGLVTNPR
jgi:hypothetical protein